MRRQERGEERPKNKGDVRLEEVRIWLPCKKERWSGKWRKWQHKHKCSKRKEYCRARKEVNGNWHDDVVAENTIKKAIDKNKMTWDAVRGGSCTSLFRTQRRRKERSGQHERRQRKMKRHRWKDRACESPHPWSIAALFQSKQSKATHATITVKTVLFKIGLHRGF